ncbi:MAG: glutaredoxin [Spirochaetes bacterium]|uniref:Glutaredoxin n=1 Tax=Candidatus Ornithospirochaeta stercoravium TaxID=2840897 RepID=A0A9D9NE48_9SPIO|nr:glutaredoxin [Candidatus Ornithospirochaeta stercoravium]
MLQVIGTAKSKDTQKAVRYLKERNIPFQFVDLTRYSLSPKEWKSILSSVSDTDDIIDKESQYYKKNGYAWRDYDPEEEVILHPELLVLPVLRKDGKAVVGWDNDNPEVFL